MAILRLDRTSHFCKSQPVLNIRKLYLPLLTKTHIYIYRSDPEPIPRARGQRRRCARYISPMGIRRRIPHRGIPAAPSAAHPWPPAAAATAADHSEFPRPDILTAQPQALPLKLKPAIQEGASPVFLWRRTTPCGYCCWHTRLSTTFDLPRAVGAV